MGLPHVKRPVKIGNVPGCDAIGLSIVALVKRESDPKLSLITNRIAMGCVILSWIFLVIGVALQIVAALQS